MVRFSQTLDDKQSKNREKSYRQVMENPYHASENRQSYSAQNEDRFYSQPSVQRSNYHEDNFHSQKDEVIYEMSVIEKESVKPDYSKPELKFPADQNIQFGVEYAPNSKPPVIGRNYTIRSNSIIYNDVVIGDNFRTGHNVVIRENTNIGDDVLIGTNTVIEGDVIIGNDVSIQSNVYIPTNSVIEDNVFIGPCACFTNDKYPVRINYELQGPKVRRGASIGGNTTFLSNVEVGEGSIVAAGAIVIHSVPPFYLAIGTPARIKPLPDHLKVPNKF
ncbi:transferase family hexapeptide repeat protein [Methanobrevibacter gottschalkii DSM 11977]|uniref:Transferase family hexapeptide repeat protein n=1 Tax=Methanobrevibacter gottschalkii DSM 11977 TaxID=1122229 RepID=A0A3N5B8Q0_9EURY|nr:transferase family hexapeptide repeat protein [Methanobrevibacter gottschalkii DSM 11977]